MKDITTIIDGGKESDKPNYTLEQKQAVSFFIGEVMRMFPNYRNEMLKDEHFKSVCRQHASRIVTFSPNDYRERLEKLRGLIAVQNLKGLAGNYKSFEFAILSATGDRNKLNHDYRVAYPNHDRNEEAYLKIEQQRENASSDQKADQELQKLKDIFK